MLILALVSSLPAFLQAAPEGPIPRVEAAAETPAAAARVSPQEGTPGPDDWRERERELLGRIAELEESLRRERALALARTDEWIAWVKVLQGYTVSPLPNPPEFITEGLVEEPDPAARALAMTEALARARGDEIERELRSLLVADGVRTLDILEVGSPTLFEGRGVTGPVVARVLDERGRLTGMFSAERMWVEVSRAARSATLVLEEGYQTQRGVRTTFDGRALSRRESEGSGRRRIHIPAVEPDAWVEALPDLVDVDELTPLVDDGTWNTVALRATLGELLRASAVEGGSSWRLVGLGGVRGAELRDVQFGEMSSGPAGRIERRVFADRARITVPRAAGRVTIEFYEGAVRRGDRTAPFLDGVYRLVLPYADVEAWRRAEIPLFDDGR